MTDYSTAVVIGDVIEIGDGRWATESGEPPAEEEVVRPNALYVYRVITVEVSDVVKQREGEEAWEPGSSIEVRALGGTIGCLTFLLSGDFQFEHGDEVALFLGAQPGLALAPPADLDVIDAWPIRDGVVHGRDGHLTVEELLDLGAQSP